MVLGLYAASGLFLGISILIAGLFFCLGFLRGCQYMMPLREELQSIMGVPFDPNDKTEIIEDGSIAPYETYPSPRMNGDQVTLEEFNAITADMEHEKEVEIGLVPPGPRHNGR